jgi:hypothetical protein
MTRYRFPVPLDGNSGVIYAYLYCRNWYRRLATDIERRFAKIDVQNATHYHEDSGWNIESKYLGAESTILRKINGQSINCKPTAIRSKRKVSIAYQNPRKSDAGIVASNAQPTRGS